MLPGSKPRAAVRKKEDDATLHMLRPEPGLTVQRTRISVLPGSEPRAAVREIEDAGTVQMIKSGPGVADNNIYVAGLGTQGGCPRERGCWDRADAKAGAWCGG